MGKRNIILDEKKRNTIIVVLIIIALISIFVFKINLKREESIQTSSLKNDIESENEVIDENIVSNDVMENEIATNDIPLDSPQTETNEQKEKEKSKNENYNDSKYYIKVNIQCNVVTIYKNESGKQTPLKAMTCSSGTATPKSGVYRIPARRFVWGTLFGHGPYKYVYGHYVTTIVGNILFHSVPYTENGNPASLEYLEYNKLGTKASAGCIRLAVKDSKWIYYKIPNGTPVEFYSDSNPGPLGKPSTKKIPVDNAKVRNWDPTDDNKNNPWFNKANFEDNGNETKPNDNKDNNNSSEKNIIKQDENTDRNGEIKDNGNASKDDKTNENTDTENNTNKNNETKQNDSKNEETKQDINDNKNENTNSNDII